jgi:hypothetical protein
MSKRMRLFLFTAACLVLMLISFDSRANAQTIAIPPGSKIYIIPNDTDPTFTAVDLSWTMPGSLQDRMNYLGLFSGTYNLSLVTDPSQADYWLDSGSFEITLPDTSQWILATLSVITPSNKHTIKEYFSRAAYPTYDELYIARKVAQQFQADVHN